MARTDIHRPSAIDPAQYTFIGVEHAPNQQLGYIPFISQQRAVINAHMVQTGGTYSNHEHKGNCHVCGAHCIYTALFHHAPTNVYIRTGFDCAEKMGAGDPVLFRRAKDEVAAARTARAGKLKAEGVLKAEGLAEAWIVYLMETDLPKWIGELGFRADTPMGILSDFAMENDLECQTLLLAIYELGQLDPNADRKAERIVADIVDKLVRYGSLSIRQLDFLRKLVQEIKDRPAKVAAKLEQAANTPDVVEGRHTIKGTILSFKQQDSQWGSVTKMLVMTEAGYKVWGTCPQSLDASKGDEIELTGTFTRSDRDTKFGFFSRPTARILKSSPVVGE